jgi:hypothetical protein
LLVAGLLLTLAAVLLPVAAKSGTISFPTQVVAGDNQHTELVWGDIPQTLLHPAVLAALALAWVLQRGSADLSVWIVYCVGGTVAARLMAGGHSVGVAGLAAAGVGLGVGAFHAAIVNWTRIPGWAISTFTAIAGAVAARVWRLAPVDHAVTGAAQDPVLLVGWLMLAALVVSQAMPEAWPARRRPGPRASLALAMLAAPVLSALGGVAWVIRSGSSMQACPPVGDLRILAAAILAGGLIVRGPMRALMAGVLVGPAMLIATVWQVMVWDVPAVGWPVNLLVLSVMAAGVHVCGLLAIQVRRPRLGRWVGFMFAGIVVLAASVLPMFMDPGHGLADMTKHRQLTMALRLLGAGVWLVGLAGMVIQYRAKSSDSPRAQDILHE